MPEWKVPLADVRLPAEEIDAVVDTYRSRWLSMGPRTESLERSFAEYTRARHAIAVTNGTAALHLICVAAGIGPGDDVIVPSLTFVATVNAVVYAGGRPVFADVGGLTEPWVVTSSVEAAITRRTKAIMAMAYGGHPGEIEAIRALAADRDLVLLEDAAHAAGARLDGRHLGTFGLAGAFSFFSNKNLGIGEGGMVVTDDDEFAARARLLRSHGMTSLTWDRHRGHATGYDVISLGFNYRIDEPRACLAEQRLRRLDDENSRRARLVERYRSALSDVSGLEAALPAAPGASPAHHLFTVVVAEGVDRERVRESLRRDGVQTSVHYPPAHLFSIYADAGVRLDVTETYAARTITLPLFAHMTEGQQDLVVESLRAAVESAAPVS